MDRGLRFVTDVIDGTATGFMDHGDLTGLLDDDHPGALWLAGRSGAAQIVVNAVNTDGVIRFNALAGTTGNILSVERAATQWLRVAGDGQTYLASSTTAGILNIGGVAGGTSLAIGSSGTTPVLNHVMGASDFNYRITGTGAITWRHTTAGNALAGTWDGNFLFQPPTGTTTTVPLTVRGRASQTGNLANFQDSTPTTLSFVDSAGGWNGPIIAGYAATFRDSQFTITDQTDTSKTLVFQLGSSTANADLTLDYRSAVDRSLIWNLSGGTGGNLQFNWAGTASRTITIPSASSYTLAGTNITTLQTWTGAHSFTGGSSGVSVTVYPTSDIIPMEVRAADFSVLDSIFDVYEGSGAVAFRVSNNVPYVNTVGSFAMWPSGVGTGFSGTVSPGTPTANRTWVFPNVSGTLAIRSQFTPITGRTTSITSQTIVASGTSGLFLVVVEMACTTAGDAGDNVTLTLTWTDLIGAQSQVIVSRDLSATGSSDSGAVIIKHTGATAIAFFTTLTSPGAGTPAHSVDISATLVG